MLKEAFKIGTEFYTGSGKWRATDVGTRVVIAIKIENSFQQNLDLKDLQGPPYLVEEVVFDEYDFEGCALTREELWEDR